MVKRGRNIVFSQFFGYFFGFAAAAYIYYCAARYTVEYANQLYRFIFSFPYDVCQIGTVETFAEYIFRFKMQLFLNVFYYFARSGSRQGQYWHVR